MQRRKKALHALLVPTTGLCKDLLEIEFKRAFRKTHWQLLTGVGAALLFSLFSGENPSWQHLFLTPIFGSFLFAYVHLWSALSLANRGVCFLWFSRADHTDYFTCRVLKSSMVWKSPLLCSLLEQEKSFNPSEDVPKHTEYWWGMVYRRTGKKMPGKGIISLAEGMWCWFLCHHSLPTCLILILLNP